MAERSDLCVVGAGAAGLWAAQRAAELLRERGASADVLLLEKTARTGTKVLASGGTRCNLTTTLDGPAAARLFGREGERFLRTAFRVLSPRALRERFEAWGVATVEAPLEKIFPASGRARDVRDALERACRSAGVRVRPGAPVVGVEAEAGGWRVTLSDGDEVRAERLLLAPGGASVPRTGTTGDGYAWLRDLGLEVVEPVPALVPLTSSATWVHELTGLSVQDAVARLRGEDGRVLGERRRPVLFTHRGLSGPGPMDLSRHVAREPDSARVVEIDLLPEHSREALSVRLREASARKGAPTVLELFAPELPRRLVAAVAGEAGLEPSIRANEVSRSARHRLVEALKALAVPVDGTTGFDAAEVTAGGLALSELDPGSLRVKRHAGLFVFGEVIDLDGPIGGLNFQAAWSTAELAARAAAAR